MRLFWKVRIAIKNLILFLRLGPITEFCKVCGVEQSLVWTAPDELWEELAEENIYCPRCFNKLAENKGYFIRWIPRVEGCRMAPKSKSRGHEVYWDGEEEVWRFSDTGEVDDGKRACAHCGERPTAEGYDACLGFIEGAEAACCGHGEAGEGYVIYKGRRAEGQGSGGQGHETD